MRVTIVGLMLLAVGCQSPAASWRTELDQRLPVLGHRNFVVIADSAYPAQSNPGIRTIYTDEDHLTVIGDTLAAVEAAAHVNPVVYVDAELDDVPDSDAPGIGALRADLAELLSSNSVRSQPHMEIIRKLDKSAELFEVLILKTRGTLPYTSVFIELDCGYWNADAEERLRNPK